MPVVRDEYGVPHASANGVEELAYEQGQVTAQDRAWQLEHARLKAEGRLSTILGPAGVDWDTFARRIGIEPTARRRYDSLSAETQSFTAAYVEGVNAGLVEVPDVMELDAVEPGRRPGRWLPWTPLAVFAAQHVLFATFPTKLWRAHLRATVGPELAGLFNHEAFWAAGSNAWAVGGGRTASGLPLVGGDPHRSYEAPNVYQQIRLTCPEFDVAGFAFPGVPGVQHFAQADTVAWGITNAMGDYQDVYEERLQRRDGILWCDGPDGPVEAAVHTERIQVRGDDPVSVEVIRTPNGPVFHGGPDDESALSLRTASDVAGWSGFECFLPLLRARTATEVEAALVRWVEPVNNLVVADTTGDVRQRVVGLVPERAEENRWRPVPGWDPTHQWSGWVADLPSQDVGPHGQIVTANNRMTPDFDRVGVEFAPPARAARITALLTDRSDLTAADFASIHMDVKLPQPAVLVDAVLALSGLSESAIRLQAELREWDQLMQAGSLTAAAYVEIRESLVRRLAASPTFARISVQGGSSSPYGSLFAGWFLLDLQLSLSLPTLLSVRGFDVVPDLREHLAAAVEEVAARPAASGREWGSRHVYQPYHALANRTFEKPPGLPGDNDCVSCHGTLVGTAVAVRGPVARYVWDLSDRTRSGWIVPLGACADPRSPHHHDQTAAWVEGRLNPVSPPDSSRPRQHVGRVGASPPLVE